MEEFLYNYVGFSYLHSRKVEPVKIEGSVAYNVMQARNVHNQTNENNTGSSTDIQFIERNASARWAFRKKGREDVCMKDGHIAYIGNGEKKRVWKERQGEKDCDRK